MVLLRPAPGMYETDPSNTNLGGIVFNQGDFGSKSGCPSDPFTLPPTPLTGDPTGPMGMSPPSNFESAAFVHGDPLFSQGVNPSPPSDLGLVDTIIKRGEDIVLNNIGDTQTIDIEIVALSLQSVSPITVSYIGGLGCSAIGDSFFDITVEIDTSSPSLGSMTFERTGITNGVFTELTTANTLLRFENTNPSDTGVQNFPPEFSFDLTVDDVPFSIFPLPDVAGEIIPIETTSLILAGAQSFSWMIPVLLSGIGIGLFIFRKSENSKNRA